MQLEDVVVEVREVFNGAQAGGRHAGFLRQLPTYGKRQLRKSVASLSKTAALHVDKINHPERYVAAWDRLRESHRASILKGWESEIRNAREQIAIIEVYRNESGS